MVGNNHVRSVDAGWFSRITGFEEVGYSETQRRLETRGDRIVRRADGQLLGSTGRFERPTLAELRPRWEGMNTWRRRTTVRCIVGDARTLHAQPEYCGALFQVASQFN